jgi:hypothetical protein
VGLRQEDVLPSIIFNIALEKAARDSGIETIGTTYNKTIKILAYSDDIVLVERDTDVMKEAIIHLNKAMKDMRLIYLLTYLCTELSPS